MSVLVVPLFLILVLNQAYQVHGRVDMCNNYRATMTVNATKQSIYSIGFPGNYRSSQSCGVHLRIQDGMACADKIELKVVSVNMETCCDYLKVYDGTSSSSRLIKSLTGSVSNSVYNSSGRSMYLYFRTDGSVQLRGFHVTVRASTGTGSVAGVSGVQGGSNDICAVSSVALATRPGYITSPGFPLSYSRGTNCDVIICTMSSTIIKIKMVYMELGEKGDVITIRQETGTVGTTVASFIGDDLPEPLFLANNSYRISFRAGLGDDSGMVNAGFNMSFMQYRKPIPYIHECGTDQINLIATETEHIIASAGFPHGYQNSQRCTWLVSTDDERHSILKISVHNMSLEDTFDFLRIYDGMDIQAKQLAKYTGNMKPHPVYTSGPDALIVFSTDLKNTQDGFRISYIKQLTIPQFSDIINVTSDASTARFTVQFTSVVPYTNIVWMKNGDVIYPEIERQYAVETIEEKGKESEVYFSTLIIHDVAPHHYGQYKVSVQNDHGISDMTVFFDKPEAVPAIVNASTSVDIYSVVINVSFFSNPVYEKVEWARNGILIRLPYGKFDASITSSPQANGTTLFTASLRIVNLMAADILALYRVIISNSAGTATRDFNLHFPVEATPVIDERTETRIGRRNAHLKVTFSSLVETNYVEFRKDGILLEQSSKYTITTTRSHNAPRIHIPRPPYRYRRFLYGNETAANITLNENTTEEQDSRQSLMVYRETHILTIISLTEQDFATYKVTVKNSAGTAERYIEFERSPVFPFEKTCSQTSSTQLTCRIESCSLHRLLWIHSVGNITVRSLEGSQTGNENTLTIQNCEVEDGGAYSCAIARDNEINNMDNMNTSNTNEHEVLMGGTIYLHVNALPIITTSRSSFSNGRASIQVSFSSAPRYTAIRWYKGNREILPGPGLVMDTHEALIAQQFHGRSVQASGYSTGLTFSCTYMSLDCFGRYKVKVENKFGHTTYFVTLKNPDEGPPTLVSGVEHIRNDNSSTDTFSVRFRSYQTPTMYALYREGEPVSIHDRYNIALEMLLGTQFRINLTIHNMQQDDFGTYRFYIRNEAGYAESTYSIENPDKELAVIPDDVRVTLTNVTALAEATFSSEPHYTAVKWYKGDMQLTQNDRYTMTVERAKKQGDNVATLVITSLNDDDMGTYKIVVWNEVGLTEKHFTVERDCEVQ